MISEDEIHFSTIKEGREGYFVTYAPPIHGYQFATLNLTFAIEVPLERVAHAMEVEGARWLFRYPLPLMVSGFGPSGDLVYLHGVRPENFCMLYAAEGEVKRYWRLLANEEMPQDALSQERLLAVYHDVPYRTSDDVKAGADEYSRKMRFGWYLVLLWTVVAPGAFLVLEYFGPQWLATLVFLYCLYKATKKTFKMTGRWKKSAKELANEEEYRLMEHHHYHCKQNPESFLKLKMENFEQDQRARIRCESTSLNRKS